MHFPNVNAVTAQGLSRRLEESEFPLTTEQQMLAMEAFSPVDSNSEAPTSSEAVVVTAVCHLCGEKVGVTSFCAHLAKSKASWEANVLAMGYKEEIPRPPEGPEVEGVLGVPTTVGEELESYNRQAKHIFEEFVMCACPYCKEKFWPPDRFMVRHVLILD